MQRHPLGNTPEYVLRTVSPINCAVHPDSVLRRELRDHLISIVDASRPVSTTCQRSNRRSYGSSGTKGCLIFIGLPNVLPIDNVPDKAPKDKLLINVFYTTFLSVMSDRDARGRSVLIAYYSRSCINLLPAICKQQDHIGYSTSTYWDCLVLAWIFDIGMDVKHLYQYTDGIDLDVWHSYVCALGIYVTNVIMACPVIRKSTDSIYFLPRSIDFQPLSIQSVSNWYDPNWYELSYSRINLRLFYMKNGFAQVFENLTRYRY